MQAPADSAATYTKQCHDADDVAHTWCPFCVYCHGYTDVACGHTIDTCLAACTALPTCGRCFYVGHFDYECPPRAYLYNQYLPGIVCHGEQVAAPYCNSDTCSERPPATETHTDTRARRPCANVTARYDDGAQIASGGGSTCVDDNSKEHACGITSDTQHAQEQRSLDRPMPEASQAAAAAQLQLSVPPRSFGNEGIASSTVETPSAASVAQLTAEHDVSAAAGAHADDGSNVSDMYSCGKAAAARQWADIVAAAAGKSNHTFVSRAQAARPQPALHVAAVPSVTAARQRPLDGRIGNANMRQLSRPRRTQASDALPGQQPVRHGHRRGRGQGAHANEHSGSRQVTAILKRGEALPV